jgi:hypothetical protein
MINPMKGWNMKRYRQLIPAAALLLLMGTGTLQAAERSAKEVLKNAYAHLKSMQRYAFDAVVLEEEANDGKIVKTYRQDLSIKVSRPDKLRVDTHGDIKQRSSYLNHGLFTMIDHSHGYYGQLKTPVMLDKALDFIIEKYGINAPLASLVYSDMEKRIKFRQSKYFGTVKVDGTTCDYVAFKNPGQEVHAWITTGEHPLIKAYSIIDTKIKGAPRTNTTIYWKENPNITEQDFIFTAPENAVKISIESAN